MSWMVTKERASYKAWATRQNYKFEGKKRDNETGNDDFGARFYRSNIGRWMSADWSSAPVPYANLTKPQTLNLYAMVSDNPETFAGLDGHDCNTASTGSVPGDHNSCAGPAATKTDKQGEGQPAPQKNGTNTPDSAQDQALKAQQGAADAAVLGNLIRAAGKSLTELLGDAATTVAAPALIITGAAALAVLGPHTSTASESDDTLSGRGLLKKSSSDETAGGSPKAKKDRTTQVRRTGLRIYNIIRKASRRRVAIDLL